MGSLRIKAIIFDLGNVLVDFDHNLAARRIAEFTDKGPEEIFNLFFDSELTGLFEEGRISPLDFFSKIKDTLVLKVGYDSFLPIWNEVFFLSEKNRQVYLLAQALKKKYRLALLSNVNILHFDYLKKEFTVFDVFHHLIASYEIGYRKPHPLIYRQALGTLEAEAGNVFYTDDRPELIEGARALGIRGFVFRGIEQLKQDLSSAGVGLE